MKDMERHRCLIYEDGPSEQLPVIVPLLQDGLKEGCRCLYFGSPDDIALVKNALAMAGVDVPAQTGRGALVFSSERPERFDPQAMVASLCREAEKAVRDGFAAGLCATGDMAWELGDGPMEQLLEYEARLDAAFKDTPLRGICQYRRGSVPRRALRDAVLTHPVVYSDGKVDADNLFYTAPELSRQFEGLRERNRELEALNEELQAFSYSVSHDLRAPLRHIDGFAQIILRRYAGDLDAEGREYFELVLSSVKRMSDLIDALFSLANASRVELKRDEVDMSAEAERLIAELRRGEPSRSVAVEIQPGLRARGDARMLSAALGNLLGNAWKFTGQAAEARVCFGSETKDGRPVFFVRDNGAGFDLKLKDKLFKPFQRLHARTEYPGSGVGLATTRRILRRHGGDIWAESEPGRGAAFYFTVGE